MSYSLTVYSVDLEELLRVPGSRNRELLGLIRDDCPFADDIQQMIEEDNEEGNDRIGISFHDAVAQFVNGKPLEGGHGFVYGYAFEAICWGIGSTLDASAVPAIHTEKLDAFLKQGGVPLRLSALSGGGAPLDFPEPGDFPFIGWWSPELILRAEAPLNALSLDKAGPGIARSVEQIRAWLEETLDQGDFCLIGFVY